MVELKLFIILFVAFGVQDVLCKRHRSKKDGGKIVGGSDTTIQMFPYQAYLLLYDGSDYYQCGGSIVSKNYIITAAHCLEGIKNVFIRIGSTDSDAGGYEYEADSFNTHPLYNATASDYDIGVVKVYNGMHLDGNSTKSISLVKTGSDVTDGQNLTLTGWGATSEGGSTSSTLKVVTVPAVDRPRCNELLGGGITTRMFCAGTEDGGKDSCQGDSGGPAVTDGKLAGVVSFGYGCARPNSPGVYTRIGNLSIRFYIRMATGLII